MIIEKKDPMFTLKGFDKKLAMKQVRQAIFHLYKTAGDYPGGSNGSQIRSGRYPTIEYMQEDYGAKLKTTNVNIRFGLEDVGIPELSALSVFCYQLCDIFHVDPHGLLVDHIQEDEEVKIHITRIWEWGTE